MSELSRALILAATYLAAARGETDLELHETLDAELVRGMLNLTCALAEEVADLLGVTAGELLDRLLLEAAAREG